MTVIKRDGRWTVDFWYEGKRYRKKSPIDTQRGAKEFERLLLQRLMQGEPLTPQTAKSEESSHCAYVPVLSQGMARDVCEDEQQAERGLLEGVDHPLSPLAVLRQAASLRNRGSRARALQERATLEGLVAEDDQQPALGPSEGAPLCAGVGRDRGRAYDQMDEGAESRLRFPRFRGSRASFRRNRPSEYRPMVATALKAGLRLGELLALRQTDVDLVNGQIFVKRSVWKRTFGTPKNGLSRRVPIPPSLVRILRDHRHLRGELVFCQEDGLS